MALRAGLDETDVKFVMVTQSYIEYKVGFFFL